MDGSSEMVSPSKVSSQSVGDSGSAAPNARCHLLLGEAALDEHLIGASLFQRRQVGSLQILDERELENRLG